jgi:sugar O-acyltransferase (sialic acid O-acetyltransferase NeuD family)
VSDRVVVFGGGGHGKVVCDILLAAGARVEGFIDDQPKTEVLGLPVLGARAWLLEHPRYHVALGVGDNARRATIAAFCETNNLVLTTAIHPRATVASSARIGAGAAIMAGAIINPDAILGAGVIVNTGAVVEHDNHIGAFAHISPNAALGGNVRIGDGAHIGIGATVLPGVCVGDGTVVGGGAVVVRDLPAHVVARGVPARVARRLR